MGNETPKPPAPGTGKADQNVHEVKGTKPAEGVKVDAPKPAAANPANPAGPLVVGDPPGTIATSHPAAATSPAPGTLSPGANPASAGPGVGAPTPGTGTTSDPDPAWVRHEGIVGAPGDTTPAGDATGHKVGGVPQASAEPYTTLKGGKSSDAYRKTYRDFATTNPGLVHALPHPDSPDFNEAAAQALVQEKIYGVRR